MARSATCVSCGKDSVSRAGKSYIRKECSHDGAAPMNDDDGVMAAHSSDYEVHCGSDGDKERV